MIKDLSILIPVYNSENCLQQTVEKTIFALTKMNVTYEIILIDDASTDKSWNLIKKLKATHQNIIGVRFNRNFGQHNALLCGIKMASGNYIVTIDDDLEQNPEDIAVLYETMRVNDYDMVYGMPKNIKKSILRVIVTTIYKKISRIENKNAGEGSAFRILNKSLKDNLLLHDGALFFMDEIALWYTDKIGYEKVNFQKSLKSTSRYKYSSLFSLSLRVISLSSVMPLKIVRTLGFYIFAFSILLAIYFVIRRFIFNVPLGFTATIVAILFSTGVIAFSLGIIGEYLGNLISLHNRKPSYSVKEQV